MGRVDTLSEIGWAGYDEKVVWLPPEHYLPHGFGAALATSCRGRLIGQGPDGKLLVRVREGGTSGRWSNSSSRSSGCRTFRCWN
jgi:hypothetical protein